MRKIEYCEEGYFNYPGEKNKPKNIKPGLLHCIFVLGSTEDGLEDIALIELPDGTMYYRDPRQIRFLEPPEPSDLSQVVGGWATEKYNERLEQFRRWFNSLTPETDYEIDVLFAKVYEIITGLTT